MKALNLAFSLSAVVLAVACGRGGGSVRVDTRGNILGTGANTAEGKLLTTAFRSNYNPSTEANMQLARRLEGATAHVVMRDNGSGAKSFDVDVKMLIGEENKNQPASVFSVAGTIAPGQPDQSPELVPQPNSPPLNQPSSTPLGTAQSQAGRLGRVGLAFRPETSAGVNKLYRVYGFCGDELCNKFVVMIRQLAGADTTTGQAAVRRLGLVFTRKPNQNPTQDSSMDLTSSGQTDPKNPNSGVRFTFEQAVQTRQAQGLPIAPPEGSSPAPVASPTPIASPTPQVAGTPVPPPPTEAQAQTQAAPAAPAEPAAQGNELQEVTPQ